LSAKDQKTGKNISSKFKYMKNPAFIFHLAIAIIVTVLSGLIYVTVQQSYRSGANDPQLQLAKDIAAALKNNRSTDQLIPKDTIEISESLAPFVVLYNKDGEPIRSTGLLDGNLPKLPKGVFDFARKNQEDILTWQPRREVRVAMVIESVQSSGAAFVAAGRSLLEVEKRESNLTTMVFTGWLICMGILLIHWLIAGYYRKKN
jgi:hypothetical protein